MFSAVRPPTEEGYYTGPMTLVYSIIPLTKVATWIMHPTPENVEILRRALTDIERLRGDENDENVIRAAMFQVVAVDDMATMQATGEFTPETYELDVTDDKARDIVSDALQEFSHLDASEVYQQHMCTQLLKLGCSNNTRITIEAERMYYHLQNWMKRHPPASLLVEPMDEVITDPDVFEKEMLETCEFYQSDSADSIGARIERYFYQSRISPYYAEKHDCVASRLYEISKYVYDTETARHIKHALSVQPFSMLQNENDHTYLLAVAVVFMQRVMCDVSRNASKESGNDIYLCTQYDSADKFSNPGSVYVSCEKPLQWDCKTTLFVRDKNGSVLGPFTNAQQFVESWKRCGFVSGDLEPIPDDFD